MNSQVYFVPLAIRQSGSRVTGLRHWDSVASTSSLETEHGLQDCLGVVGTVVCGMVGSVNTRKEDSRTP